MKLAILYDVDGWAYHAEARSMAKYLKRYSIKCDLYRYPHFYQKIKQSERDNYDGVYLYPRQARPMTFPADKTIVKFSSFGDFSKQGGLNSTDFKYIVCTNRAILNQAVQDLGKVSDKMVYMPLCIDSEVFYPKNNLKKGKSGKLIVGFAGNSNRKGKGFDLIVEAAKALGDRITFKTATYHGDDRLTYEEMPDFYRSLDLLVCMSTAEGGPLTSFEAGMCGVPTISGCSKSAINEVTVDGYNSFHIDRNKDSLVSKIVEVDKNREILLTAKYNIAETMYLGHSWDSQARSYARLVERLK